MQIPKNSIVYLDPPYKGVTGYRVKFDHEKLYKFCRNEVAIGNELFISEYDMPKDFYPIWSKTIKKGISNKRTLKDATEKLFVHKSQLTYDLL